MDDPLTNVIEFVRSEPELTSEHLAAVQALSRDDRERLNDLAGLLRSLVKQAEFIENWKGRKV